MGLWNPHENPKCLGPFMLPLGVPSHAQVSLFKSFLCESFRSLITQLSFLFKKELHFHPHLETVTESCKSSTKIFPTLARVNTSTHMHVCVDKKKTAFSSSLNTERWPEIIAIQNTSFLHFLQRQWSLTFRWIVICFFKSSIFLTLFVKTTFPCSRCKIYLDWKVLNGIWVYSHETILSSLRRMHCIRASDKCLLQIKLSPSPASW